MAYETTGNAGSVGTTTQVVVALFNNANDAHQAVTQLRANGFSPGQIGAAFRSQSSYPDANPSSTGAVRHEGENWWEKLKDVFRSDDKVEARKDSVSDSTLDAEPYVNTDPYARGEYEYDFVGDDFGGSLAGTGISSNRAAYLARSLNEGGAIVTVRDANRVSEAEQILSSNHGKIRHEDIPATAVAATNDRGTDLVGTEVATIDAADSTGREITDTGDVDRRPADAENSAVDRVQLFGEVLRVHKERISRGEVRVHKDVVTENQTIEVPVTREELVLERVAVSENTPASSADIGTSQEIRIPLTEDKVRLEKQPVVREEVLVGKRDVEDVARVGDEVRHEELRVDSDPEIPKRGATGEDLSDDVRRHG